MVSKNHNLIGFNSENIKSARKEIDNIDSEILRLLGKRFNVVKVVMHEKELHGLPVTDPKREEIINSRWLNDAKKHKIPESLASKIINLILEYSKQLQISNNPQKVMVIGYGGMARNLARSLVNSGNTVYITGRDKKKAKYLAKAIGAKFSSSSSRPHCGHVILCIPSNAFKKKNLGIMLANVKNSIVYDILSSKSSAISILEGLAKENGFNYISLHPLFGPDDTSKARKIAAIPIHASKESIIRSSKFWNDSGFEFIETNMEKHEKTMAIVQVLRHMYSIPFYDSVVSLSESLDVEYSNMQTSNFKIMFRIAESIKKQDLLAREIAQNNPYSRTVLKIGKIKMEDYMKWVFANRSYSRNKVT